GKHQAAAEHAHNAAALDGRTDGDAAHVQRPEDVGDKGAASGVDDFQAAGKDRRGVGGAAVGHALDAAPAEDPGAGEAAAFNDLQAGEWAAGIDAAPDQRADRGAEHELRAAARHISARRGAGGDDLRAGVEDESADRGAAGGDDHHAAVGDVRAGIDAARDDVLGAAARNGHAAGDVDRDRGIAAAHDQARHGSAAGDTHLIYLNSRVAGTGTLEQPEMVGGNRRAEIDEVVRPVLEHVERAARDDCRAAAVEGNAFELDLVGEHEIVDHEAADDRAGAAHEVEDARC